MDLHRLYRVNILPRKTWRQGNSASGEAGVFRFGAPGTYSRGAGVPYGRHQPVPLGTTPQRRCASGTVLRSHSCVALSPVTTFSLYPRAWRNPRARVGRALPVTDAIAEMGLTTHLHHLPIGEDSALSQRVGGPKAINSHNTADPRNPRSCGKTTTGDQADNGGGFRGSPTCRPGQPSRTEKITCKANPHRRWADLLCEPMPILTS